MLILLPLALIGVGLMIYLLFAAATFALPLFAGLSAGFAARHLGASDLNALLFGIVTILLVTSLRQIVTQLLPSRHARVAFTLLFAVPASIAGYEVASALSQLCGIGGLGVVLALAAASMTGAIAAGQFRSLPHA
jgi:hypothetical protein